MRRGILKDVVSDWQSFELDDTLYCDESATVTPLTRVEIHRDPRLPRLFDGKRYLIGIEQIRDAVEGLEEQLGRPPTVHEKTAAVLYYAEHDAFLDPALLGNLVPTVAARSLSPSNYNSATTMSVPHPFTIPWSIPDEQWAEARRTMAKHGAHSSYDRDGDGRYQLLYGDIDFVYDGEPYWGSLYGAKGINISLFDLAVALADAYLEDQFAPGAKATYNQLDDDFQIEFQGESAHVRVTASDRATPLVVPRAAFERGVVGFLRDFAAALEAQIDGALEWDSVAPLKRVLARSHPCPTDRA